MERFFDCRTTCEGSEWSDQSSKALEVTIEDERIME